MERFPLAPMSRAIRVLTGALLAIPVCFLGLSWLVPQLALLAPIAASVVALYAAIWVWWRPSSFEVSGEGLCIRFPGTQRYVPTAQIAAARTMTGAEFRAEAGLAVRIGVGGLWGGFGWLWTQHRGLVEFYVSRLDGLVWIERRDGRPLLLSPSDPSGFVRALGTLA
jgi:PH (Pleckstrin Homology) domain-containing protein